MHIKLHIAFSSLYLKLATASDNVHQLLAHGRWFSLASSPTKTDRHDIAEKLLKVALNTVKQLII